MINLKCIDRAKYIPRLFCSASHEYFVVTTNYLPRGARILRNLATLLFTCRDLVVIRTATLERQGSAIRVCIYTYVVLYVFRAIFRTRLTICSIFHELIYRNESLRHCIWRSYFIIFTFLVLVARAALISLYIFIFEKNAKGSIFTLDVSIPMTISDYYARNWLTPAINET